MVIKKTPQKLDTVSVTGDILKISLTGDGEPAKEVTLPSGGSGGDGVTQVASVTALRATSGTTTKDVYLKSLLVWSWLWWWSIYMALNGRYRKRGRRRYKFCSFRRWILGKD